MRSRWYSPERPKWLGPLPHDYPAWLPAEAPGNYAFDPAGLSKDAEKFDRYFELELLHARWAMLGMLGAVLPGVLLPLTLHPPLGCPASEARARQAWHLLHVARTPFVASLSCGSELAGLTLIWHGRVEVRVGIASRL